MNIHPLEICPFQVRPGRPLFPKRVSSLSVSPGAIASSSGKGSQADPPDYGKVFGAVGAGSVSLMGRLTVLPVGLGVAGAALGSFLGPIGAVVGGLLGSAAGLRLELKGKFQGVIPVGRVVGAAIGGAAGLLLGKLLNRTGLHLPLPEKLTEETRGFSYGKLLHNLTNPKYTSHQHLTKNDAQKYQAMLRPGDLLITNNDTYMDFEIPEKILGARGDWTHSAIYAGNGKVVESLGSRGVIERGLEELVTTNHHLMILRPRYRDAGDPSKVIQQARSFLGRPYDNKFSLKSDDKLYCIEHTFKSLTRGAPYLDLKPSRLLSFSFVTPKNFIKSRDMDLIYSTGSNFYLNYLSKFD